MRTGRLTPLRKGAAHGTPIRRRQTLQHASLLLEPQRCDGTRLAMDAGVGHFTQPAPDLDVSNLPAKPQRAHDSREPFASVRCCGVHANYGRCRMDGGGAAASHATADIRVLQWRSGVVHSFIALCGFHQHTPPIGNTDSGQQRGR